MKKKMQENYKRCAYCRNENVKMKIENNFSVPKSKFKAISS